MSDVLNKLACGSITSVTDAAGAVLGINRYDEYGIPASTNMGRFGYTGQTWLPEVGLYSYKARMYSPTLGRFMQTDPIGYGDGMNWYNYAGSDPVNGTDPSGLESCNDGTNDICLNGRRPGSSGTRVNIVKTVYFLGKSVFCGIFGCKKNKAFANPSQPAAAPDTSQEPPEKIDPNCSQAKTEAGITVTVHLSIMQNYCGAQRDLFAPYVLSFVAREDR